MESVPAAEYQEWPFQGFLKHTKIRNDTTYHLKFKLLCICEHFDVPIDPELLEETPVSHKTIAHSKIK